MRYFYGAEFLRREPVFEGSVNPQGFLEVPSGKKVGGLLAFGSHFAKVLKCAIFLV